MPRCTEQALHAERQFRRYLAPVGITFDAPLMVLALEVAATAVSPASLEEPALTAHPYLYEGLTKPAIRLYPIQVTIARRVQHAVPNVSPSNGHALAKKIIGSIGAELSPR